MADDPLARIKKLYAEAQRQLAMGNANHALHLQGQARELERAVAAAAEAAGQGRT